MKLIIVFGPAAVGKMTVGLALQDLLGYKLFHNHMVTELLYPFWGYRDPQFGRLNAEFRRRMFEELGRSAFPGVIFTYVWALDEPGDHEELKKYIAHFGAAPEEVFFVELAADQAVRLERNRSELRLREKKSKNNLEESEGFIHFSESRYRLNSQDDFFYPDRHLKIDNTDLNPEQVALLIRDELVGRGFHPVEGGEPGQGLG